MKIRHYIISGVLIIADQLIKILVYINFFDPHVHIEIIEGLLAICPYQNTHRGTIFQLFDYTAPVYIAVSLSLIVFVLFIVFYRYTTLCVFNWNKYRSLPMKIFSMGLAAFTCSIIDNAFWGGSIDFIRAFDTIIFDLKDIYAWIMVLFTIFYLVVWYVQYFKLPKEMRKEYSRSLIF